MSIASWVFRDSQRGKVLNCGTAFRRSLEFGSDLRPDHCERAVLHAVNIVYSIFLCVIIYKMCSILTVAPHRVRILQCVKLRESTNPSRTDILEIDDWPLDILWQSLFIGWINNHITTILGNAIPWSGGWVQTSVYDSLRGCTTLYLSSIREWT